MRNLQENLFGLYEKALPKYLNWEERLVAAKNAGYDFMEISIDETDERIGRLQWSKKERTKLMECIHSVDMPILSMCLSANRRYPIGSEHEETRSNGIQLIRDAIDFAVDCGIRVIQLAGYDEYANPSTDLTVQNFHRSLAQCARYAQEKAVMLALETMENDLMDSIRKAKRYVDAIRSPWLKIYPDLGISVRRDRTSSRNSRTGCRTSLRFISRTPCPVSCAISRLETGMSILSPSFVCLRANITAGYSSQRCGRMRRNNPFRR